MLWGVSYKLYNKRRWMFKLHRWSLEGLKSGQSGFSWGNLLVALWKFPAVAALRIIDEGTGDESACHHCIHLIKRQDQDVSMRGFCKTFNSIQWQYCFKPSCLCFLLNLSSLYCMVTVMERLWSWQKILKGIVQYFGKCTSLLAFWELNENNLHLSRVFKIHFKLPPAAG